MTPEILQQEIFADIPKHEAGKTSSIGGTWPPERTSFNRVKAFYTDGVIDGDRHFKKFIQTFNEQRINPEGRVQFRAVMTEDALKNYQVPLQDCLEVAIPLGETSLGKDLVLVYLGANGQNRQPDPEDLANVSKNLEEARKVKQKSLEEIFNREALRDYSIDILNLSDDEVEREEQVGEMAKLYERFGWNKDEVRELLNNPNNIISVAKLNGKIISAGIAELASVLIGENTFEMAEITEAATLDGHDGRGLYTAVSAMLLRELARRSRENSISGGQIDLVFGECNGLSLGVLKAVRAQGRIFAADVAIELGYPGRGIIFQQVPISAPGVDRKTANNDLAPAYLTRDMLIQYYGQ